MTASLHADSFSSGVTAFTIDFVEVGNAGNADDRALDETNDTPGDPTDDEYAAPYGGVAYAYRIGTYEITEKAIALATIAGMTHVTAGAWSTIFNQPAANVSWYEAAAFVNWLNTSTGHQAAYNLTWTGSAWIMQTWTIQEAWQAGGENRFRHKDAYYFLPSEDEWHKAAYHKNDGVTANYWDFATESNTLPTAVAGGTAPGTAVYAGVADSPAYVDFAGGRSAYGTMGQTGNLMELAESADDGVNDLPTEYRPMCGGYWGSAPSGDVRPTSGSVCGPSNEQNDLGFRVASVSLASVPLARADTRLGATATALVGNNIYNLTGTGQTLNTDIRRGGGVKTDYIRIQNDGPFADSFKVRGTPGDARFAVKYFKGTTNVTSSVVAGTFTTGTLAPGASRLLTARIKARTAVAGKRLGLFIKSSSVTNPASKDTALIKAKSN